MAFASKRDENNIPAIFGVSSIDLKTPTAIKVNPSTGAMLIDAASLEATLDTRYILSGAAAGGDLTGTYPNPTVSWANGQTTFDARYIKKSGDTMAGTLNTLSLIPIANNTYNLGSSAPLYYSNAYISTLNLNSTAVIDGVSGGAGNIMITGQIGFGTTIPDVPVVFSDPSAVICRFINTSAPASGAGAGVLCYSDGTTPVTNGGRLGFVLFGGATDAVHSLSNVAGIMSFATELWSGTTNGADLEFYTCGNSGGARTLRLKIDQDGTIIPTDGRNIQLGTTTGMKIGTATNQKLGFFNTAPAVQQTQGATLTNNITSGGTANTLANYTSLTTYSTDAAAIRNNIYQLGQTLKTVVDALRLYGLLS